MIKINKQNVILAILFFLNLFLFIMYCYIYKKRNKNETVTSPKKHIDINAAIISPRRRLLGFSKSRHTVYKKYKKKPVIIEARQTNKKVVIRTLEGDMTAEKGDWIVIGIQGEMYPVKPDIFEATYEALEEKGNGKNRKPSK